MGGQTALNLAVELAEKGILDKYKVELIGAKLDAIRKSEDRELFKEAMKKIMTESFLTDTSLLETPNKLKDVQTLNVIINELLAVKEHLPSTTNLAKVQVHGVAKLKTVNQVFKSPLIDEYVFNIQELKRSETSEPYNMLKGFFDMANHVSTNIKEELSGIDRILGRKGR